jgi:nucleotide-binding universal stress UspA family protein
MLATHGHGPVRRFLLGSVSAKILHDLDCAVWTATAAALESRSAGVKFVLSALDGGDTDETVARAGAALAASYGAQLALVHVVEPPIPAVEMDYAIIRKELLDAADQRLREIEGTLGLDAAHAVLEGGVALRIRDEAVRLKADLIVTGRGRDQGVLSRFWSHLYSIVRDAPCPVLSI